MSAFFKKELRELVWVAIPLAIAAIVLAFVFHLEPRDISLLVLAFGIGTGVVLGGVQGLFDRFRRDDPFLLHRQVSWIGQHAARTVAGGALVLFLVEVNIVTVWLAPARPLPIAGMNFPGVPVGPAAPTYHPGLGMQGSLAVLSAALLVWATVRLAVSTRSKVGAALLVCSLPPAVLLWVARLDLETVPILGVLAALAVCCTLSVLNLARPAV